MPSRKTFNRFRQPKPCIACGKLTTYDSDNTELCKDCYEACGIDNAHSDGHHAEKKHPECPACQDEA
jgi:hypothetical protein